MNTDIVVTPNPTTDFVTVKFNAAKVTDVSIYLYDNTGKTMVTHKQKTVRGNNSIVLADLNKFNAGVYELKLVLGEETFVKKLMIWK